MNTDFRSEEWRRDLSLLRRFPAGHGLLELLRHQWTGVDFERDVKPALGNETDLVWLDVRHRGNDIVGLTKPRSRAKLKALFAKAGGPPSFSRELGGWTVFASSRELLDRFEREAKSGVLADESAFKDAVGRLDARAAFRLYVSGKQVQAAIDRGLAGEGAPPLLSEELGTLEALAVDVSAKTAGVRFGGIISAKGAVRADAYTAKLPEQVPAGALLYVSFNHLDLALKKVLKVVSEQNPTVEQQLSQVSAVMDVTLGHDVYPLLSHEGGLAVYPGKRSPTILVLLQLKDEARAKGVLARLVTVAQLGGSSSVTTRNFDVGGIRVTEVGFSGGRTRIFGAVFGERLVVSNAEAPVRKLIEGGGPKLAGDARFRDVQQAAKMPQQTLGFVYVNLHETVPAALASWLFGSTGSFKTSAGKNTEPVQGALFYATRAGDRYAVTGFVTIK